MRRDDGRAARIAGRDVEPRRRGRCAHGDLERIRRSSDQTVATRNVDPERRSRYETIESDLGPIYIVKGFLPQADVDGVTHAGPFAEENQRRISDMNERAGIRAKGPARIAHYDAGPPRVGECETRVCLVDRKSGT